MPEAHRRRDPGRAVRVDHEGRGPSGGAGGGGGGGAEALHVPGLGGHHAAPAGAHADGIALGEYVGAREAAAAAAKVGEEGLVRGVAVGVAQGVDVVQAVRLEVVERAGGHVLGAAAVGRPVGAEEQVGGVQRVEGDVVQEEHLVEGAGGAVQRAQGAVAQLGQVGHPLGAHAAVGQRDVGQAGQRDVLPADDVVAAGDLGAESLEGGAAGLPAVVLVHAEEHILGAEQVDEGQHAPAPEPPGQPAVLVGQDHGDEDLLVMRVRAPGPRVRAVALPPEADVVRGQPGVRRGEDGSEHQQADQDGGGEPGEGEQRAQAGPRRPAQGPERREDAGAARERAVRAAETEGFFVVEAHLEGGPVLVTGESRGAGLVGRVCEAKCRFPRPVDDNSGCACLRPFPDCGRLGLPSPGLTPLPIVAGI